MRSIATYNEDVACVTGSKISRIHSHGVKTRCVLNKIPGFHAKIMQLKFH